MPNHAFVLIEGNCETIHLENRFKKGKPFLFSLPPPPLAAQPHQPPPFPSWAGSAAQPHLGMAVGPVGMDTRGFRTHRIWIRVQKLTRGSYRVGYPKYIGSGMDKILYPRVSSGYPKYQYTSLNVLHPLKMCYIH
jgi:hypothetical protein